MQGPQELTLIVVREKDSRWQLVLASAPARMGIKLRNIL
jgi:hypothetical protein